MLLDTECEVSTDHGTVAREGPRVVVTLDPGDAQTALATVQIA